MSSNTKFVLSALVIIAVVIILVATGGSDDNQPADAQPATTTQQTEDQSTTTDSSPQATTTQSTSSQQTQSDVATSTSGATAVNTTVRLTADGFTPETVTVSQGETVEFVNESSGSMWVGSDRHPTHTQYDGTSLREHCQDSTPQSFDQCQNSDSFTFTFEKSGEWEYHNHTNPGQGGTVIVN